MSLYPIVLVAVIMAADGAARLNGAAGFVTTDSPGVSTTLALLGPALCIAALLAAIAHLERRVERADGAHLIVKAERLARLMRLLIVINHVAVVLVFDWLTVVRNVIGDLVGVDELIVLTPAVIGFFGTWWAQYPIERRVHEAMLIRRLDRGLPVFALPTRARYVWRQAQLQLLFLLVPLVLILLLGETFETVGRIVLNERAAGWARDFGTFGAAAGVFVFAPLLARAFLNVQPLPPGPMREALLNVCRRHEVNVRDILVWHTDSAMINAAVMGLFGRLRYVLLTDALLETLTVNQAAAVMAHEVGHIRRHHMPWLVAALMACLTVGVGLVYAVILLLWSLDVFDLNAFSPTAMYIETGVQLVIALLLFGWISRRFERQADTFAVQHFSGMATRGDGKQNHDRIVTPEAAGAMQSALQLIADVNHVDPQRPSWRHGSIRWRQEYLMSIVGRPVNALEIDRIVRRLKWIMAGIITLAVVAMALIPAPASDSAPTQHEQQPNMATHK